MDAKLTLTEIMTYLEKADILLSILLKELGREAITNTVQAVAFSFATGLVSLIKEKSHFKFKITLSSEHLSSKLKNKLIKRGTELGVPTSIHKKIKPKPSWEPILTAFISSHKMKETMLDFGAADFEVLRTYRKSDEYLAFALKNGYMCDVNNYMN